MPIGRRAVEVHLATQERPDVSVGERTARDLVKRIRKLRWMGMDEEARQMQLVLRRIEPEDALLAGPCDTD
jgi:hypothetical protein